MCLFSLCLSLNFPICTYPAWLRHSQPFRLCDLFFRCTFLQFFSFSGFVDETESSEGCCLDERRPLLLEIAQEFSTEQSVRALATYLLENVGQGGMSFLSRLKEPGALLDPQLAASKVLREWVKRKPGEANGKRLFQVLNKPSVNKVAALKFKNQLLHL